MTRPTQVREWRDDIPRGFTYVPPVVRPRPSSLLRVIVTAALGR